MAEIASSVGKIFTSAKTGQVLSTISGGVQGVGQILSARQETQTGDFNARVLEDRAKAERASQKLLESQKRKIFKSRIGTQVTLFAKSGIKMTGSPIEVLTESLANAEMDIAIDKYNSEVAARGLRTEAEIERIEGRQRASVGFARAGATFLSTAAKALGA